MCDEVCQVCQLDYDCMTIQYLLACLYTGCEPLSLFVFVCVRTCACVCVCVRACMRVCAHACLYFRSDAEACTSSSEVCVPEQSGNRHCFLCVGLACLDVINVCPRYPDEDEDLRAVSQEYRRGGNAANTACVLTQLPGVGASLLGTMPSSGWETDIIEKDLHDHSVDLQHCVRHDNCRLPTSFVVLSQATGSCTIVHYRKLDELRLEEFISCPLDNFSWIHFEGRNLDNIKMLRHVDDYRLANPSRCVRTSVEVEKRRPQLYPLMRLADVVFVSKEVAQSLGHHTAKDAVLNLKSRCRPDASLICAWGADGADAFSAATGHLHCSAFPPPVLVDTLAAGDTFIAGVLFALSKGESLSRALQLGCWLAGCKCGQMGTTGLLKNLCASDPVYDLLR